MPTTPDTVEYLFLGLSVVFGFILLLIGSMFLRYQSLLKDEQTINHLLEENNEA
jgi:hypothetical protein